MAVSVSIVAIITSLHLIAFVLAVGAERRRSTAKVVPDEYDETTYCVYDSDASTAYGLSAFGLLLISQTVVNGVTKCFCFGKGLMGRGSSTTWAVFFFIFSWGVKLSAEWWPIVTSLLLYVYAVWWAIWVGIGVNYCPCDGPTRRWVSFLGAEACLLAGSARNAYHTKYRVTFGAQDLSCATLRKGVFAAGAALTFLSMVGSVLYYWVHSKADTGGWEKHRNEGGLGMTASSLPENHQQQRANEFEKA